jgi:hypothetical protein
MSRLPLAALALVSVLAPTSSSADIGSGRDPFAVYGADVVAPACVATRGVVCVGLDRLRLRGVVTGTASPRALLEDDAGGSHLVRVGDVVDGLRVTALRRDRVVLERTLRTFEGALVRQAVELRL